MARREEGPRGPSQRQLRVGEEIRRVLSRVLERGELHDPVLTAARVTLSEVSISPDLRNATVWVVPPIDGDVRAPIDALTRLAGRLGGMLARELRMKYAPRLTFKRDVAFDTARRMDSLLSDPVVRRDVESAETQEDLAQEDLAQEDLAQEDLAQEDRTPEANDGP